MPLKNGRTSVALQQILVGSVIPPGTIQSFGGVDVPAGWLLCDGSTVSRSTYSALFDAIGTANGEGDSSTTFHLPDLRGRFLRGADNMGTGAAGRDLDAAGRTAANAGGATGDTVGSVQGHQTRNLTTSNGYSGTTRSYGTAEVPEGSFSSLWETSRGGQDSVYRNYMKFMFGTEETRPQNANANYIIKV
jgi:microcystin-dependent protein